MSLTLLPDIEQLMSSFLGDQSEIVALVGDRVYTAVPKAPVWPLLLVRRIGGVPIVGNPLRVDQPIVQLDAYGGTKKQARDLCETARAAIQQRVQGTHATGVVASFRFGNMNWLPDQFYEPAKPRYVADVTLTVRSRDAFDLI